MRRMRRGKRPAPLTLRSFHVAIAEAVRGYDPAAPGPSEGQGASAVQPPYELHGTPVVNPPLVQAPYELDGTPIDPSSQNGSTCVKGCDKKCPENKCVKATRRTVSFRDDSSTQAETSESEAQTSEGSSKAPSEAKKNNSNKSSNENSAEEESESQTGEASASEAEASSANEDPGWTISQDCLLRGMKEGDSPLPWTEIATALGKTKTEVADRWNLIKDLTTKEDPEVSSPDDTTDSDDDTSGDADDESESDTDQESDEEEEEEEDEEDEEEAEIEDSDDDDTSGDAEEDSDVDYDDSDDDNEEEYEEANTKGKGKSPIHNKWHTGIRNEKVAAENKKAKANAKVKAAQQDDHSSSGEDASSESSDFESSSSDSQVIIGDSDKRADMRYLQDRVYKLLYPPEIHPEPDENFCKKDCELLGSIDSKYKKNRWLEMQANFFNVTGRLIPLELIRAKCERAEAERAEKEARRAKRAAEREKEDREKVKE
ncbi:hypothetical protein B0J15DRAFT_257427 [Fusarium solani]|uniref:Myb-like domain-containing protein n=1 Tax=Fusarium solani TaxID=169388 RepID=A0A9P9HV19_FUSSL|nr:uncharacterized protein B0J15DRAFT_257427 [Fusarium solani]KAH7263896.1 hypothetical protein B0J15DRAFT_257427 [Fusarium solani]